MPLDYDKLMATKDDDLPLSYNDSNAILYALSVGMGVNPLDTKELPYVYLGYWVQGSKKMAYKAQFQGVEVFMNGKWVSFEKNYDYESESKLSQPASLSDQVVQISMPNSTHIMER